MKNNKHFFPLRAWLLNACFGPARNSQTDHRFFLLFPMCLFLVISLFRFRNIAISSTCSQNYGIAGFFPFFLLPTELHEIALLLFAIFL